MDWLVAVAVFLPLLAYSVYTANQQLSTNVNMQTYEVKVNVLDYWHQLFETFGQPSDWSKNYWESIGLMQPLYLLRIKVTEPVGISRVLEPVDIHVVFDPSCEGRTLESTIRVYYQGEQIPYSLYNITYCSSNRLKEGNLVFLVNISANETKLYSLYFSNETEVSATNYTSDLSYGSYLQNSKIKLNLTGEVSDVYDENNVNLLSGRRLGLMQYNATTGTIVETNATTGSPTLVVDTPLKKVVQISGSTDWYDYKFNVTLYAYQTWFKLDAWVKEKVDVHLDDFRMPEGELYSAFSEVDWHNATGDYSSTAATSVVNASWIAPFNTTGVDSLALLKLNDTKAEWESNGEKIAFTKGSLDASTSEEWYDTAYALPFTDLNDVKSFWNKITNPVTVRVMPVQQLKALSITKLKQLESLNYGEVKKSLGGYDFRIEIS